MIKNIPVFSVSQPIGDFYVASIDAKTILEISYTDRMRVKEKKDEISLYTGIQRPLNATRIKEIKDYVQTVDASFPTSIIISLTEDCARVIKNQNKLILQLSEVSTNTIDDLVETGFIDTNSIETAKRESLKTKGLAKVLDGQHRLAGLSAAIQEIKDTLSRMSFEQDEDKRLMLENKLNQLENFQLNVSIFIGYDIHSQAVLFSKVNLAQTKVNPSLVYNLETYTKLATPQRIAHNLAKFLDETPASPFYQTIKMLGHKTEGRQNKEFLSQATIVEAIILLLSKDPEKERDNINRGSFFNKTRSLEYSPEDDRKYIFNKFMRTNEIGKIADILHNYFSAIKNKWSSAWNNDKYLLSKNNCFRALMLYLRTAYDEIGKEVPSEKDFSKIFERFDLKSTDFKSEIFPHGDGGMSKFYKYLIGKIQYNDLMHTNK